MNLLGRAPFHRIVAPILVIRCSALLLNGGYTDPVELKLGFLWGREELASVVALAFWGAYTQGKSEELVGLAIFCLFVKQIEE
jgi:hypothetical protein